MSNNSSEQSIKILKSLLKEFLDKEELLTLKFGERDFNGYRVLLSKCKKVLFTNSRDYIREVYLKNESYEEELVLEDFKSFLIPSEEGLHLLNTDIFLDKKYVDLGMKIFKNFENPIVSVATTFAPIIFSEESKIYFYVIAPTIR